jgi:hypothetical protein
LSIVAICDVTNAFVLFLELPFVRDIFDYMKANLWLTSRAFEFSA